jgi:hypothetical protein
VLSARAGVSLADLWPSAGTGARAAVGRDNALAAAGISAPDAALAGGEQQ